MSQRAKTARTRDGLALYWSPGLGRWMADSYATNPPRSPERLTFERHIVALHLAGEITLSRVGECLLLPLSEAMEVVEQHRKECAR